MWLLSYAHYVPSRGGQHAKGIVVFTDVVTPVWLHIVGQAASRAGSSDTGPDTWQEGLEILIETVASVPDCDTRLRADLYKQFEDALTNRMRVMSYRSAHPEVEQEVIQRPLVILGLPRTGTTVASYLLDQDPSRRSLLNWEAGDSVPPPTTATLRTDPRCLAKKAHLDQLAEMLIKAGRGMPHWEEADGPTECMFVQNQDFKGLVWDAHMPTPAYSDWLLSTDVTSAYQYEHSVLQILQSHAPGVWSLKMPSHAVHIEALLATFPDARLVWAHRDPFRATASLISVLRGSKARLGGSAYDPSTVGPTVLRQMRAHVDRALAVRRRIGDHRFFDLHYADLMRDPIGQMGRLYEWAGDSLSLDVERSMRAWLDRNPQDRFGKRPYGFDDLGVEVHELEDVFADYLATFDIEREDA